ncbi:NIP3-like protein [Trichinella spiralis]|uniref:NIP3-like protein n=1 Tax=Trichinella spiralis TaxID=6334 RepID=UPI0001EFB632|nr:NIP3-like protein [Trichinella spiralis]
MSSPRGTIVVNEMDVADADSWVELSHDSECGSSITFLTDPSGAHGSPHKYTPPGGQTSPVLQFDGDLERVKFQLCRQFSNIQGGKSAWLSDWSSRPEVVPPLQYRRSGTIVRTPPNSPFGSSEVETSDQSKPWFSLRHSRFVRHDWFSLELNSSSAILALITNNKCDMLDEVKFSSVGMSIDQIPVLSLAFLLLI